MLRRCLLAFVAGALLPLAFAPFGLWPMAIVSFAVLLRTVLGLAPRHAALAGWCFGVGMFGFGVWWIQVSVHQFGIPLYVFSVSVTAVFVMGMALYPALFAWLVTRFPAGSESLRVLVLAPSLWVLAEWLRAHLFTGFPWLALGYSQVDAPAAGFGPLAGVYGCSLAVAWIGSAAVAALAPGRRRRVLLAIAVALLLAAGTLMRGIEWTEPAGRPLVAALVQGAVPQEVKWNRSMREPTLSLYQALSEAHWDADVILWPETAIPAFPYEVEESLELLAARARETGTDLLTGMPSGEPWNDRYFNSVLDLGSTPGRYDKRHLVPFGEYFPFQGVVRNLSLLLSIPMSDFSPGAPEQATLDVAGYRAGVSICFEDAFSDVVAAGLPDAAFLVNVSNDAWFGDTVAPHQHLQIARMRALETGRYMLRGTNTGVTAIIDHRGRVVSRSPQFEQFTLRGEFQPMAGATPFARTGEAPLVVALFALTLAAGAAAWRRAR